MSANGYNGKAMPIGTWPDVDRIAWDAAQTPGASLLLYKPAVRWRDSSKELFVRCYGMWLAWLATEGLLVAGEMPADRLTPGRLLTYLRVRRQLGNSPKTLVNHVVSLKHMFEVLDPEADLKWLLAVICQLKGTVPNEVKSSNLPRIGELFNLGMAAMATAEKSNDYTPKQGAKLYRDGLAIAMLAARPFMRRKNLTGIRMGKHLLKEDGGYRLWFEGDDMKGRRPMGGPLPGILTSHIERYWNHHRPKLLATKPHETDAFWISVMGRPAYFKSFATEIMKLLEDAFGRRITLHDFRRAAGSSIAKEDPEHVGFVPVVLDHATFSTSQAFYIIADEHAAFTRFHDLLDRLESGQDDPSEAA